MDTDKVQGLSNLLNQAVSSLLITDGRSRYMDLQAYRQGLQICWQHYRPDLSRFNIDLYDPVVTNPVLEQKLLNVIRTELEEYIHEERIQTAADELLVWYGGGRPLRDLLKQLLKVSIGRSPQFAAQAFYQGIAGAPALYQVIWLLNGARVEREEIVSPGIRLVPLPNSTGGLPACLPDISYISPIDLTGRTMLVMDGIVSPVFANPGAPAVYGPRTFFQRELVTTEFTDFDVEQFSDALSLASNGSIKYMAQWTHLDADKIFNLEGTYSRNQTYIPFSLHHYGSVLVTEDDIQKATSLYRVRKGMRDGDARRLQLAIDRWIKSKSDQEISDSFIDIGIAFESLYLNDIGGDRGELNFRLRLRAAWHLGRDIHHRESIMSDLGKIYSLRSKAAHGAVVEYGADTRRLKEKAQQICRQSILKVIDDGRFPDWHRLVLGADN